jgi:hypothetical protein
MKKRNLILLAAVLVLAVSAFLAFSGGDDGYSDAELAGLPGLQHFDLTGAGDHTDDFVRYPQNPPAGGPHNPRWQNCGFYAEPVRNEHAVHSLEHGAVWITYRPGLPAAEVQAVRDVTRGQPFVLASPYPGLPSAIVLSAWGYQLRLASADPVVMRRFVQVFADSIHAPEPDASCRSGVGRPQE